MQERIISVGVDIGSSTTQLVFSELVVDNYLAAAGLPEVRITSKKVFYRSAIYRTPLRRRNEIDGVRLRAIVAGEFARAGMVPGQVRTGAVIITGETARAENGRAVLAAVSDYAGDCVVATAGPALEGIIAGRGSGTARESERRGSVGANLDIGGGTTNIAVFDNGRVADTACLDIGAGLLGFSDGAGRVSRVSEKMIPLTRSLGLDVRPGALLDTATRERIAARMVEIIEEALGLRPVSALLPFMQTDKALAGAAPLDFVSFSGGVADCLQSPIAADPLAFGDLGNHLGAALATAHRGWKVPVLPAQETIWATVIGAGTHTVEVSGSTISVAEPVLPLKNVPLLKLNAAEEAMPAAALQQLIRQRLAWFRTGDEQQVPALTLTGSNQLGFAGLQRLAEVIVVSMAELIAAGAPLIVVLENDLARALGQALRVRLSRDAAIICIDGIKSEHGDYIDIGRPLAGGTAVPVVVKTLLFSA